MYWHLILGAKPEPRVGVAPLELKMEIMGNDYKDSQ